MSTVRTAPAKASTDPETRVGHSFKAAVGSLRRLRGRETQQPGHLSYAQYGLLFGLADQPELSASRLACIADLAPGTVTEMLDHLETGGLVQRTRSVLDKRVVLVTLTEQGRERVERRRTELEVRWQDALAGFSDGDLLTASAVLDRLAEMFDAYEGD
jgi:MarR family transcriptional regulator, organic hydroperoxide resistance regulator